MPEKTKITLSDKELSLVKNVDWILTKQRVIEKVYNLFADNINSIRSEVIDTHVLPENVKLSFPKIYKGENYRQLPYVIMDYPRCFEKENIFALRTMFWWGNFFSITLHLGGKYKSYIKESIYNGNQATANDFFICVNSDQWQHHFEEDNFLPITKLSTQQRISLFEGNDFIKLAIKFSLDKWNEMPALLHEGYKSIGGLLFNSRSDEKDL